MTSRNVARGLTLLAPLLFVLATPALPADATTTTVTVANDAFTPSAVTVALGSSVTWSFKATHTTTSNQGFWDSGDKNAGQSFVKTFVDSGIYAYHCTIHPMMTGAVKVPIKSFGTSSQGYSLRWSTRTSTPSGWHYDIQVKPPGSTQWVWYRQSTTTRTATFNPSKAGTYALRVRTHNAGGGTSAFSTVMFLKIT